VGLGKEKNTTDAIFTLQQIVEKREFNLPTYILFIDYEKAYGNVNRGKLWQILHDENIPFQLQKAIQSVYKNSKVYIKYHDGQLSDPINTNKGADKAVDYHQTYLIFILIKLLRSGNKQLTVESS
jgi:hypothetical protein